MILKLRFGILILLLIVLSCGQIFAQRKELKDSIIYIQEVAIQNNKHSKIAKAKTVGIRNEIRGFNKPNSKFVSLVRNIPRGRLRSVCFHFTPGLVDKKMEYEFGLLIYEVDANGKPSEALSEKDVRFKLKASGKGKIKLDLRKLFLNSEENLFFGFAIYTDIRRNPIRVKFSESKSAISFFKELESDWLSPVAEIPYQLKLDVEVDPDN